MTRSRAAARAAALLALGCVAVALAGCGGSSTTSPAELALEREDLVFVTRALQGVQPQTEAEVAATRAAWPLVVNGLPTGSSGLDRPRILTAVEESGRLVLPALLDERQAAALTGAAVGLAGLYRAYAGLASRGWEMIGAAIYQIEHGSPAAARFARANVDLYIESVYDSHFGLGQIGKQLAAAYKKLGGPTVFGTTLTQQQVDEVSQAYSQEHDRLNPHERVKLGS